VALQVGAGVLQILKYSRGAGAAVLVNVGTLLSLLSLRLGSSTGNAKWRQVVRRAEHNLASLKKGVGSKHFRHPRKTPFLSVPLDLKCVLSCRGAAERPWGRPAQLLSVDMQSIPSENYLNIDSWICFN